LHTNNLNWLNSASIALIPNKEGAEEVTDFRPISLVHAIAKLISKMMATRLAPFMHIEINVIFSSKVGGNKGRTFLIGWY
jgi:hypothetical protein